MGAVPACSSCRGRNAFPKLCCRSTWSSNHYRPVKPTDWNRQIRNFHLWCLLVCSPCALWWMLGSHWVLGGAGGLYARDSVAACALLHR